MYMKNLLFYYASEISPSLGGVERVVSLLYYELSQRGYHIFTIYGKKIGAKDAIPEQYLLPDSGGRKLYTGSNIEYIQQFIREKHIDVVLNFAAVFNKCSLCLVKACIETGIPFISVLHNTLELPLWNIPIIKFLMEYSFPRFIFRKLISIIHRVPFYKGAYYMYKNSVCTVVLAPCYVEEYKEIVTGKPNNLIYIYNPLSIPPEVGQRWENRQPIVLFVGRLERQKAIHKLIKIWKKLDKRSWKLFIIGSGSQEQCLKKLTHDLRVSDTVLFMGHCSPLPYYKIAKIFCMTSIYEGYPMTLIECQSYGVVPVIYGSFPAAYDLIESGKNGIVAPAFKEEKYLDALHQLMNDDKKLQQMSVQCQKDSERYSVDRIMQQWTSLIERV